MKKTLFTLVLASIVAATALISSANEVDPIYGHQLMTPQERQAHQAAMRNAKTPEEQEMIRQRHHEQMRERAKAKGVPFPDEPPAERGRMNQYNK